MTEPIQTLAQQLIHRATDPFGLAILTGVTSSSFWLFGSLGLAINGLLPATITQSERAKRGVSETSALKMWEWMFNRAKVRGGLSPSPYSDQNCYMISVVRKGPPISLRAHRSFPRCILRRLGSLPVPRFG